MIQNYTLQVTYSRGFSVTRLIWLLYLGALFLMAPIALSKFDLQNNNGFLPFAQWQADGYHMLNLLVK